jgi:HAD superfamily hydrolase (TIGR01490 family)
VDAVDDPQQNRDRCGGCAGSVGCVTSAAGPAEPSAAPPDPRPSGRTAAFFDLDKTVIAKSSTLAMGGPLYRGGLIGRRAVLSGSYAQFVFLLHGADARRMDRMRDTITQLCRGWSVAQVREIVDQTLEELIIPMVHAEAVELIRQHQAEGRDVVLVSSSGAEVVEPIGALIGVDHVVATRMRVAEGCYTGEIEFYAYGPHKATAISELAAERGYELSQCYAYSDSITDLPMLEVVGHPYAVNPDRALARTATERQWQILRFARPVQLRRRGWSTPPARSAGAALSAAGAGALAVVAATTLARRRRP